MNFNISKIMKKTILYQTHYVDNSLVFTKEKEKDG